MNFKDYRHKETIRAAIITEDEIALVPYSQVEAENQIRKPFERGDYCLIDGVELYGSKKADFEALFEPRRAERQTKTRKKREKVKAADA